MSEPSKMPSDRCDVPKTQRRGPGSALGLLRQALLGQIGQATANYPRVFWFLFWGVLINRAGTSIIWPFMTIYLRQRLGISLTTVALLLTLNSFVGLGTTAVAGPIVDRFGRKGAMLLSLVAGSATLIAMGSAGTLPAWAILMVVQGTFSSLFPVGSDAMVADLIPPERRAEAYALLRLIANLGVVIGPIVGGFVTGVSYALAFCLAAAAELAFALLILVLVPESLPQRPQVLAKGEASIGYGPVLRDRYFLALCGAYTLATMAYSLMMTLLPVYIKEGFGVPERQFGFIMTTNAIMVVLLQYTTTRITGRHHPVRMLAVGSLFYALGAGSVAWGKSFPMFLCSMVVFTIGEMITVPMFTSLTANLAPSTMRGRYMSVHSLTWWIGYGIGPVIGGMLNDRLAPVAMWYSGLAMALLAAAGFALLGSRLRSQQPATGAVAADS